jgi:hypothetical protein
MKTSKSEANQKTIDSVGVTWPWLWCSWASAHGRLLQALARDCTLGNRGNPICRMLAARIGRAAYLG